MIAHNTTALPSFGEVTGKDDVMLPRGTSGIASYRDLKVWQKAVDLVVLTYRLTKHLPEDERYGLSSQMRRASVSVPSNIAEGAGRLHLGDYLKHLSAANGSLKELETQFIICRRLRYVSFTKTREAVSCSSQVGRMLSGLVRRLEARYSR